MDEVSALEDNFWTQFNREATRAGFPTAPEAQVDEWTREFDASAGIKTEQDAAIGSDGRPLSTNAARHQTSTRRPLFDAATEAEYNAVFEDGATNSTFNSNWGQTDEKDETVGEFYDDDRAFAEGGSNRVQEPADAGVDEPSSAADGTSDSMEAEPYRAADEFIGGGYEGDIAAGADARSWFGRQYDRVRGWFKESESTRMLREELLSEERRGVEMQEFVDNVELGENLPLDERPTVTELSEASGFPRDALGDLVGQMQESGMSNEAIASELGIGMSKGGGLWISRASLGEYLAKQGKGLLMSPAIGLLAQGLNQVHDGVGDMVSLGLIGADLLMTGDPLGVLMYGMAQLWDAGAQSRQKVIDNDTPDKDYGTKMGFVREGDTWYPAIFNQRYKSTGLWAADQQITLDYGHDIVWKMDGSGKFVPMIPNAKSKNFVASDNEWEGKTKTRFGDDYALLSSKDFVTKGAFGAGADGSRKMLDTTRDWFFLSPEEMKQVQTGDLHLEAYKDDYTKMNASARQLNDWRKALDYSQDWKWSSAVKTMGKGAAVNNYAGSRGLQRLMYESTKIMDAGVFLSSETDYDKFLKDSSNRQGDAWDSGHSLYNTFGDYLMKTVLRDHVEALYRAQVVAAKQAGFDDLYGMPGTEKTIPEAGGTIWSSPYLDMEKDMPTASTAEELSAQLHEIEMMNDRTPAARNYLAQKVQTRYWMQQIGAAGGSKDMMEFLYGDFMYEGTGLVTNRDLHGMHKYTASGLREFQKYMPDESKFSTQTTANKGYMQGFVMPWQNAGEGFLPTYTGALAGTSAENYLDDWQREYYENVSTEGWDNLTKWISKYGKVDPNLRIDGQEDMVLWGDDDDATAAEDDDTLGATAGEGDLTDDDIMSRIKAADDAAAKKAADDADTTAATVQTDDGGAKKSKPEQTAYEAAVAAGILPKKKTDVYNLSDLLQMVNKLMYEKDPDTAKAEWLRMGKRGGFIDDDFTLDDDESTRTTASTSHRADSVVATSGRTVITGDMHEDLHLAPMSSVFENAIRAAEHQPVHSAIKVV